MHLTCAFLMFIICTNCTPIFVNSHGLTKFWSLDSYVIFFSKNTQEDIKHINISKEGNVIFVISSSSKDMLASTAVKILYKTFLR